VKLDSWFFGLSLGLLLVVGVFYLGWASGHSYGLVDNVSRCPPKYISSPCSCEICVKPCVWESCGYSDWSPIVRDGRVIGCLSFEDEMDILLEIISESMECEPVNLDLQLCVSGGECNSGVCIDGVCYDGSG